MLSQRIRSRVYCVCLNANEGREDFVTKTHLSFRSCFRARLHGEFHPGLKFQHVPKLSITWGGIQPGAQFSPG